MNRIGLYTHALLAGRERLMPWRMVLEVARSLREHQCDAVVLSGSDKPSPRGRDWRGVPVVELPNPLAHQGDLLKAMVGRLNLDCIFWPVAWRTSWSTFRVLSRLNAPVVGYFPGGFYRFRSVVRNLSSLGVRTSIPYLADALAPQRWLICNLKEAGVRGLVTATDFTRRETIRAGWPPEKVVTIPPGVDDIKSIEPAGEAWSRYRSALEGRRYFLFMGSSAPIRGARILLAAFDRLADVHPDIHLACLIRTDPGIDAAHFLDQIRAMRHHDRVVPVADSLSMPEMLPFLVRCYAVVLPFLLVPSEIPLTFFEVMSLEIPIVTTESSGTSEFVREAACIANPGDVQGLYQEMHRLLCDERLYYAKKAATRMIMQNMVNWDMVGERWLKAGQEFVDGGA